MDRLGDDLTGAPILVTGASGYLGQRVLAQLRLRGIAAVAIVSPAGAGPGVDLTRPAEVQAMMAGIEPDAVIHCAARVPKGDAGYADEAAARDSLLMVANLMAARPRHMVFPSSMTVYRGAGRAAVREEDAARELTGYAGGKLAAESLLLGAGCGKVSILRLPGLFGPPRRGGFIYNAALALAEGRTPQFPRNAPLWAALHVDDAADMCVRAAVRGSEQPLVVNAGYPGRMSLCAVLRDLARISGRPAPMCDAPSFEMDLTRLERELGAAAHAFDDRLLELVAWARQHARNAALMNAAGA